LKELKKIEGNDKCIDCGESDPQWASLNYGVLLCSKCYDIHRSLSEEDTFFSLTNDKWSEDQIKRLQFGGNNNAIKFFETQSEYLKDMSIKEKYTSNFSKIYSDKL
ncbi:Arf GTPase activating protein, partial [Neocallimastix californiae]